MIDIGWRRTASKYKPVLFSLYSPMLSIYRAIMLYYELWFTVFESLFSVLSHIVFMQQRNLYKLSAVQSCYYHHLIVYGLDVDFVRCCWQLFDCYHRLFTTSCWFVTSYGLFVFTFVCKSCSVLLVSESECFELSKRINGPEYVSTDIRISTFQTI